MKKKYKNVDDAAPIHVLHLIDRLTGNGTGNWLWDIVGFTSPDKVKHFVITFSPDKGKWVYGDRFREKGIYHPFPMPRGLKWLNRNPTLGFLVRYVLVLWQVFKSFIWFRPAIIHVHTCNSFTVGLLLKGVLWRPLVHTVPLIFSQMEDVGKGWLPKLYARFYDLVDCFFTGASREELREIGIPDWKIFPLRGVIDLHPIEAVRKQRSEHNKVIRKSLCLPSDSFMALSVGRLHPTKGHLYALEALPSLVGKFPQLHWVVLGEGKQHAELEERAKDLGVSTHVHLLGYQDNPLPYYAAATVYFRTVILEAENLSSYQAMAMGLPVVGFDTGCETELLKDVGHGILVPNKDINAFSAAVIKILTLPDRGRGLGGLGLSYSEKNFDIRKAIADYTAVYTALKNGVKVRSEQLQKNVW